MPAVTLATCAQLPTGDEDGLLLTEALSALDADWQWAAWNDPSVDWNMAGLVVVRSTWDYPARRNEFLAWAEHEGVDLTMLYERLQLTPTERVQRHQMALELVEALRHVKKGPGHAPSRVVADRPE